MSAISTVITLWDYVVVLLPLAGWVAVGWTVWRCSEAEDPRVAFRKWMPVLVIVACVSTAGVAMVWRRQVNRETREMSRYARIEAGKIGRAALAYHYDLNEWPEGGNREVIATLTKAREDGRDAYLNPKSVRLAADGTALDPWRRPYLMEVRGEEMMVWSTGPDGVSWTEDDVSNN